MSEWLETILELYITVINGFAFKSKDFIDSPEENYLPVLKIKNVASGEVTLKDVQFHEYTEKYSKYIVGYNDILLALTGNHAYALSQVVGEASISKLQQPALLNQRVAKIIPREGIDNLFLFYFLKDDATHHYLANQSSGSANQANISKSDIEKVPISLPPLPEQKAIASVLSSLDDKIDLLHHQNKTLEAMVESLFRQWFVEEADENWADGKVLDYCTHHKEGVKPQDFPTSSYTHFSIPAFDNYMNPVAENGSEIQSNKYTVVPNCLLFSKLNPNKDKRIWLILDHLGENPVCSTEFQVVLPKNRKYLFFIFSWLSTPQNYNEIASGVGGTSGSHQRIDPTAIFNFPCPRVEYSFIESFNVVAEPIFTKMTKNRIQIRNLEKLRDTLLPKLMSGEVRIHHE